MEVLKGLILLLGTIASLAFILTGFKILLADQGSYFMNRDLTGPFKNPLKGTVPTFKDGVRDCRVKAGLAIDLKNNTWVEQGALSDESIDAILDV